MAQFISLYVRKQQSGFPSRVITEQGVQCSYKLEISDLEKKSHHTIYVGKTKVLISCAVTDLYLCFLHMHLVLWAFFMWHLIINLSVTRLVIA